MKIFLLAAALTAMSLQNAHAAPDITKAKRIVVLGDSITYAGDWVTDVEAWLLSRGSTAEVINLGLPSETAADLTPTEQQETHIKPYGFPRPTISERLNRILEKSHPDWILACYGMNDGSSLPQNDDGFARFQAAMETLKTTVEKSGVQQFIALTPPVQDAGPGQPISKHDEMLARFSEWLISKRKDGWNVIDLHGPMRAVLDEKRKIEPNFRFAGDGVHPNREGHDLMAKQVIQYFSSPEEAARFFAQSPAFTKPVRDLVQQRMAVRRDAWLTFTGHTRPGVAKGLPMNEANVKTQELTAQIQTLLPPTFPGTKTAWNGSDRYDFPVGDKICTVIVPATPLPGKLWAWKGEFLDAFPKLEIELLKRGVYIVTLNTQNLLGSPEAVRQWNGAYAELTQHYGMAKKAALIGLSRGGLYCYNWAIANPDKVACIFGDAAVVDMKSWPGGKGKGKGSPGDWQLAAKVYGFKDEAEALAFKGNPIDNLKPLADAKIPLFHIYGDADVDVPWDENAGVIAERYKALGGSIEMIAKPGVGHHPHGLDDPTPVANFIQTNLQKANPAP